MKRLLCLMLTVCLLIGAVPFASAAELPTKQQVYDAMIAMKEEYPEETPWTNEDGYTWNATGGTGYGCLGFAYLLSDAAFGDLPARKLTEITIEDVRPGDILRIKDDSHSVVVLEVHADHVIIAEGNYLGTVHWGGKLTAEEVAAANYMTTRYPEDYPAGITLTGWRKAYYDMIHASMGEEDTQGWMMSNYKLMDLNGDEYPELWVDHIIYANGCTLATITEKGLYAELMQYGALSYLEGENVFLHSGGIQGYYFDTVYAIEDGVFVPKAGGTGDTIEGIYTWNDEEVTEPEYIASMDTLVDPSKAKHGHDDPYSYEEFVALLYELEAEYGPEADIPEKPAEPVFSDVVPGAFYEEAVTWAVENEVTTGRTETTFAPGDPCKRSEVVTFLHRSQDKPVPGSVLSDFTDVQPGKFYTDAVAWAEEQNITNGMGDGTFGVNQDCTRSQVVTFLWRTAGKPSPTTEECPFTDVEPGSFYYDAVLWAVEEGITNGMTETEFGINGTCTRGQIVTFLHRFAG